MDCHTRCLSRRLQFLGLFEPAWAARTFPSCIHKGPINKLSVCCLRTRIRWFVRQHLFLQTRLDPLINSVVCVYNGAICVEAPATLSRIAYVCAHLKKKKRFVESIGIATHPECSVTLLVAIGEGKSDRRSVAQRRLNVSHCVQMARFHTKASLRNSLPNNVEERIRIM